MGIEVQVTKWVMARKKYSKAFHIAFKVPMERFLDTRTGFDLVAFDEYLTARENWREEKSMSENITEHFGKPACDMLRSIIDI